MDEPVADAARSVLDGHIVLSRKLAHRNHFPAIDVLQSISRCMPDVVSKEHGLLARQLKDSMAAYQENEDLIQIGAYAAGSSPRVDRAIQLHEPLMKFLAQDRDDKAPFATGLTQLRQIGALSPPKPGVRQA
jgi:flagellar biosynthesis/type III secretory pathway ATPase